MTYPSICQPGDLELPNRDTPAQMRSPPLDEAGALSLIATGCDLLEKDNVAAAERCFLDAVTAFPDVPMGYNNLGWVYELRKDFDAAILSYRRALDLNPSFHLARRNLAELLFALGRFSESVGHWDALLIQRPNDAEHLNRAVDTALRAGDVKTASGYAERHAALTRGEAGPFRDGERPPFPAGERPATYKTQGSLLHDIEQLRYLRSKARIGPEFDQVIRRYEQVLGGDGPREPGLRAKLTKSELALIGNTYGRIHHKRASPAFAEPALSKTWRRGEAEDAYFDHPLGLVVVDDFLSPQALAELRAFCLESTVWFANRYAHDRLGAFFRDGFNCPLLVQIANEISEAFPRLIGRKHPLLQMWGFKYGQRQPKTSPHADFAAVNVNIWITPDEANLDKTGGGLTIYDVEAPLDWDFESYNKNGSKISEFLQVNGAKTISVPYRSNRALIFNSDLFHETAPFTFRDGYENRRINVTMLYGDRSTDTKVDPWSPSRGALPASR